MRWLRLAGFGFVLVGYLALAFAAERSATRSTGAFAGRAARRAEQGRLCITESSCWDCSPKALSINSMWPTNSAGTFILSAVCLVSFLLLGGHLAVALRSHGILLCRMGVSRPASNADRAP